MTRAVRIALAILITPLALSLASCGKSDTSAEGTVNEPIAKIAPPAGQEWTDIIAKTPDGGYRMGNPDAPIKLVEFASLTCPHCAEFAEQSNDELKGKFIASGVVSHELRNFVRDPIDMAAVLLTRCGPETSFFALTDQAFAGQAGFFQKIQSAGDQAYNDAMNKPPAERLGAIAELAGLVDFFASRGISRDAANACLADTKEAEGIANATNKASKELDINATPTLIINNRKLDSPSWQDTKARLEALGAR